MDIPVKTCVLACVVGVAFHVSTASAAVATHTTYSSAVNYCQAFTPGPTNTIRNRVVGVENIGPPLAVACNFGYTDNGTTHEPIKLISMSFFNGSAAVAPISCTLLTGTPSLGGNSYAVTKTLNLPVALNGVLIWSASDNPLAGADHLGNVVLGINCTLPTSVVLTRTFVSWDADNGV